jgi:hypothetical protein
MVFELPSGEVDKDHLQVKLEAIADQCNRILQSLQQTRDWLV